MTTQRTLAGALLIGLVSLAIGCSSDNSAGANRWAGKTYIVNIETNRWKAPKGDVGQQLGGYVPKFLLDVRSAEGSAVKVVVGAGDADGKQDECTPTVEVAAATPEKQIGPADTKVHIQNGSGDSKVISLYGMKFSTIFSDTPDDIGTATGAFEAVLDLRDCWHLFDELNPDSAQGICTTLSTKFDTQCIACPNDSSSTTCVQMRAVALAAKPLSGVSVKTINANDVASSCTTGKGSLE
jgi:hypothetical protein